ncbi:hypothetical protein ACPXBW_26410, partial [Escherichia coli]
LIILKRFIEHEVKIEMPTKTTCPHTIRARCPCIRSELDHKMIFGTIYQINFCLGLGGIVLGLRI